MRILLSFLFLFQVISTSAQYNITSSYNSVHIGRNANIGVAKNLGNHSIGIALKYGFNSVTANNYNEIFKKCFYAVNLVERFGFNLDYHYNFNLEKLAITPFVFYNFQFTNSHTKNKGYLPYTYDPITNIVLYEKYGEFFGPTIALENYVGIGYRVDITEKIYINNKIGFGLVSYFNVDNRILGAGNWEFGRVFSIGIGYSLNNKEKSP